MRWQHIVLFLLFLPGLIYGLNEKECIHIKNLANAEWEKHTELINKFKDVGQTEEGLGYLRESLACCKGTLHGLETILNDIAGKSKNQRNVAWRVEMKKVCEQDKITANTEITGLEQAVKNVELSVTFQKAKELFEKSQKKADEASRKKETFPSRSLLNTDPIVAALKEVAILYREAKSLAQKAYETLTSASSYHEEDKAAIQQLVEIHKQAAESTEKEALEWPEKALAQKTALKQNFENLLQDSTIFEEKGLSRSAYELKKQALPLLETLIQNSEKEEKANLEQKLEALQTSVSLLEDEADRSRLTQSQNPLSSEAFRNREKERQKAFFKEEPEPISKTFLNTLLLSQTHPFAIPLDGAASTKGKDFICYLEQFYRFLVQSDSCATSLSVQVSKDGELVHEEIISLPAKNTLSWHRFLKDGMLCIPETKLKKDFGVDLRLNLVCDQSVPFSMIIAQKVTEPGYQISYSLDKQNPLFKCRFCLPPPWQLSSLQKPATPNVYKPKKKAIEKTPPIYTLSTGHFLGNEGQARQNQTFLNDESHSQRAMGEAGEAAAVHRSKKMSCTEIYTNKTTETPSPIEFFSFPKLDTLALELKKDPLLIAQYVYHEITLVDPFLREENGVFQAPGIHRNPLMTYLERRGSPWEQCQLLVYLLRSAGYQAKYVMGDPLAISKDFAERMLFTKISENQEKALVKYPWVHLLLEGEETISLFPWMKEIEITEGYDIYNLMPEEYASADRWILRYLKGDEAILKHITPDGNDTAALLFSRFIYDELRKQGLSSQEVGIKHKQLKRQFSSWQEFPKPSIEGSYQVFDFVGSIPNNEALIMVDISSRENPQKCLSCTLPLTTFTDSAIPIHFIPIGGDKHRLLVEFTGEAHQRTLDLNSQDQIIDIKVSYSTPVGSDGFNGIQTLCIAKGTTAALCIHFGGVTPYKTAEFHKQFSSETDEQKKLHALLSFVGATYFDKCCYGEELLAGLHKTRPKTVFAFGLAKLSPDPSKGPFKDQRDLCLPQVDMFWFSSGSLSNPSPAMCHQEFAYLQFEALNTVNCSSNEHQILREVFSDPYPISTVKLLQLSHLKHEKQGGTEEGFVFLTPESIEATEKTPEVAQSLYFPHLKDINLRDLKEVSAGQWDATTSLLCQNAPISPWSYALLTPGPISNQDGNYLEMGTLIMYPYTQYSLISSNNLISHGGLGSPLPPNYLSSDSIRNWELIPKSEGPSNHFSLQNASLTAPSYGASVIDQMAIQISDIRPENKSFLSHVADPVDTITGAFYIDEIDLRLLGNFPLNIRRNYNSQNPVHGKLGVGWKLSLNPFLTKQDGKLFAAEADGTVICYSYNNLTSRYEVDPEDNPELYNFNQKGVGGSASLFHSYIQDNILYGIDGSKRFFEDGYLKKWVNQKGMTLTFHYDGEDLSRIENSNGDFLQFHYNHHRYIAKIYTKDGRHISYDYDSLGNLIKVILPNRAEVTYEYDRHHRVIRETQVEGKILENIYDDQGRVKEQRSPLGFQQSMVTTATFEYAEGMTTITDGAGGKTVYKIYDKQIYKVIDPLGETTLQSWFIDEELWFDAETEQVLTWEGPGAFPKSLKSNTDKRGLTTTYSYDERGNPIKIELQGKDLTGDGCTTLSKTLTYNQSNLCIQEKTYGQRIQTIYDDTFPYEPKRIEKYQNDVLISYIDFEYNHQGLIKKENRNGSITLWHYNNQNLPIQKIQKTGTEDPDRITTYSYNYQGQCTKIETPESIEKNGYDIAGNLIQSETFSPQGALLSALYVGYNQNNQPIWKQTANSDNTLHLDYNSFGTLKATWQSLTPSQKNAYRLYEYDTRGYLIEEIDPVGTCTTREYDGIGNVLRETTEGISTHYTYEAGGLIETITSASGATTARHYTTNGLLTGEIYPDGTKTLITYDFFGRPIKETKNGIAWEITYNDQNHQIIRTHIETGVSEIKEFDANGHLVCFTDGEGYSSQKTYDGLGRIKTETTPSGKQTTWSYQNGTTICILPSGEQIINRYEGEKVAESKTLDLNGNLISHTTYHYDPQTDIETISQGDLVTITWLNTLGLPIKVQKGDIITTYEYDKCGNCTAIIDGEENIIKQTYDRLGRLTQKELPDGSLLQFDYDLDSNLIEHHLPNGTIWAASYDSMGRKTTEKMVSQEETTQEWNYYYQEGLLKEAHDPLGRIRSYTYDAHGRLCHEAIEGWEKTYSYDARGLLLSAEQIGSETLSWVSSWFYTPREEHSKIERSYDADGRLTYESIYLNSELIQETHQNWGPSFRTLLVGDHERTLIYQNNKLAQISTDNLDLSYTYHLSGALKDKLSPLHSTTITYESSGLPENIYTSTPNGPSQEFLHWTPTGKLSLYTSHSTQKQFAYTPCGYLQSAGEEHYTYDFGEAGIGTRTTAPHIQVSQIDPFGKVILEDNTLTTNYNTMGQVTTQGTKTFEWDPWGRLITITDDTYTWQASYDPLGRRIQTRYTPRGSSTLTTNSFFDPEEEFQEIGTQLHNKTFWKIHGPLSCEAILDETNTAAFLVYNALNELTAVITNQDVHNIPKTCSAYGPQSSPTIPTDILCYAQTLSWHSMSQDPTGLIWMGERYYDPKTGRFLSPDPVGHPICINLHAYANSDPINYTDPSGRFASFVYQTTNPISITGINSISSFLANNKFGNSGPYTVGDYDLSNGAIGFINGIQNTYTDSVESASQLSRYAQNAKVHGIYNAKNLSGPIGKILTGTDNKYMSFFADIAECGLGHIGIHAPPVQHLKNQWCHFITTHGPDAKFLQICHSGGADHVKNALLTSSDIVRQRIIVLAIAPSVIVPKRLCYESYNYMSRRDFVTRFDVLGNLKHGKELRVLAPHPDADVWDHSFLSPTFEAKIKYQINKYIKNYGGIE